MDARALKDKATQLFSKGKFGKAAETYDEYCKADPKDLQARLRLGDAWLKAGKKDKAVLAYTWAAEGFARDGFLPRAIAASKLVLEVDPTHTGVQKMLADLYAQKSRPGPKSQPPTASRPPSAPAHASPRALDLEAPPPPPSKARQVDVPSPNNRTDAIEVEAFEVPVDDGRASVGGMAATRGPSPLTRQDAIEIEVEEEGPKGRRPVEAAPIDIELNLGLPTTGEVEIPLDAGALDPGLLPPGPPPPTDQLPPELQVPVVPGKSLSPTPQPVVQGQSLPEPPPAPVYELDEVDEPPQSQPPLPVPSAPVYELTVEVPDEAPLPPPPPVAAMAAPEAMARAPLPRPPPPEPAETELIVSSPPPAPIAVPPQPPEVIPGPGPSPQEPAFTPPGLKPRRSGDSLPPQPSPFQSTPSGSRIWLPPAFAGDAAPPALAAAPASTLQASPSASSDLERSLQAFTQFDEPAAQAPAPSRPQASFTELDLEGDSLLHAVDAAAARGLAERGAPPAPAQAAEEAMEAPEEPRLEAGALPKIPLFSDLPPDAFIALFEKCPLRRFEPGDAVIAQGSRGDAFYVICAGAVRVVRADGPEQRELAKLEEGAFFGEMALLSEAPRSASVLATEEDTQVLEIGAGVLKELSAKHPSVSTALKKFCRQRLLSNLMQGSALFRPFSRSDRRELVQKFKARDVKKGEVLIKEGQSSDGLYVVLSGEVSVSVKGREVASLKEGELFGEMSLLTRSPATATVSSARHTSLLRLPREDFDRLILTHPQILAHVSELTDERAKANAAAEMI